MLVLPMAFKKKVVWEGDDVMIVGSTISVVRVMRKGISFVSGTRTVNKRDVIVPKCEDVACDPSVNFLGAAEILEIFVVSDDDHLVVSAHEQMAPMLEAANDGEEFSVPDGIASFSGAEGF